jgi:multidrug efflux system membrane fusion protein
MLRRVLILGFSGTLLAMAGGCQRPRTEVAPAELPAIPVSQPVRREVTDFVDFTGRTEAVQAVDIRPRVTGYLVKMPFKEGAVVKQGDLLFVIDPRPYQAQVDSAQGQVTLYQAQLKLARVTYARDVAINNNVANSVSQQQLDQDRASVEESDARVKAYEKNMEVYRLNHEFTRVVAPIDGQISRYYLTLGNLVNADQTLLTTVVSLDPIYVYFYMDEPTLLRIRRAINEGRMKRRKEGEIPVHMGLQGEDGYPHQGTINFVNNQVDPTTGSVSVRGIFPNPEPPAGIRLLSPGMFVRIRLPIGTPRSALLVIDRAVGSDQGLKYVYVLDAKNTVQYRRVTTGALQEDGLRVIEDSVKPDEGVKPNEPVVVGGLQQVRPQMVVKPELGPMPTLLGHPTGTGADSAPAAAPALAPAPAPTPSKASAAPAAAPAPTPSKASAAPSAAPPPQGRRP